MEKTLEMGSQDLQHRGQGVVLYEYNGNGSCLQDHITQSKSSATTPNWSLAP